MKAVFHPVEKDPETSIRLDRRIDVSGSDRGGIGPGAAKQLTPSS
jgi:hypothetical protein